MDAQNYTPGEGEFASVTIKLDHLFNAYADRVLVPMTWGTDNAISALIAQMGYFGISEKLGNPEVFNLIADSRERPCAYVLQVKRPAAVNGGVAYVDETHIICDIEVWTSFMEDGDLNPGGTVLGAASAIMAMAKDMQRVSGGRFLNVYALPPSA